MELFIYWIGFLDWLSSSHFMSNPKNSITSRRTTPIPLLQQTQNQIQQQIQIQQPHFQQDSLVKMNNLKFSKFNGWKILNSIKLF